MILSLDSLALSHCLCGQNNLVSWLVVDVVKVLLVEVVKMVEVLLEVVFNIRVHNEGEGREDPVNTTWSAVIYLVPTRRLMLGGP